MLTTHYINSTLLDFSFDRNEKDTALQKAKIFYAEDVLPQLSKRFDEEQQDIYIDRLEIDVGKTTANDFAAKFLSAFKQSWDNYSFKKIHKSQPDREAISVLLAEQFFYYLQNGYWPWNIQHKPEAEIIKLVHSFMNDSERFLHFIRQFNNKNEIVIDRLINFIVSNKTLIPLFTKGLKWQHPSWKEIEIYVDKKWMELTDSSHDFYYLLWRELIVSSAINTPTDVKELLLKIAGKYRDRLVTSSAIQLTSISHLESVLSKMRGFKEIEKIISLFKSIDEAIPISTEKETEIVSQKIAGEILSNDEEKITITNAGLILFHPYLPYVFSELKWISSDNKFTNKKNQQRAILFLQYLINQKSRQPEHLLVLNKIMCNWPVKMPLTARVNFSKKEKKVAIELCESLKEHWKVIQNTSNAGLIKSFIERKGIVKRTEDGFLLQTERSTIDVLMESLPFGIQLIKFPWNEYIIHTEWAY